MLNSGQALHGNNLPFPAHLSSPVLSLLCLCSSNRSPLLLYNLICAGVPVVYFWFSSIVKVATGRWVGGGNSFSTVPFESNMQL